MKRIRWFILLLLLLGTGAQAREIRVRKASQLQKAVNRASAGDTIILRKGVYRLKETLCLDGKEDLVILGKLKGAYATPPQSLLPNYTRRITPVS